MTRITYAIVEHDGGWAYKVGDVFSEPLPSRDAARRAAERAAHEQVLPGESTDISYEDKDGRWHEERSPGSDRPERMSRAAGGATTASPTSRRESPRVD